MSARLSILHPMVSIARKSLGLALECQEKINILLQTLETLEEYDQSEPFRLKELYPAEHALDEYCMTTIVFSALAIESYIYDYAARNLTDNYVEEHLDKLSVISKFILVTKLVTGKDFPKDDQAYEKLKSLIKNRNYIAHSKSANAFRSGQNLEIFASKKARDLVEFTDLILPKAKDAIQTLDELAITMEQLDPNEPTSMIFESPVGRALEFQRKIGFLPWENQL